MLLWPVPDLVGVRLDSLPGPVLKPGSRVEFSPEPGSNPSGSTYCLE